MDERYLVNEIYYSLHGEGVRYGIPHVFVRFAQCNLQCSFCDTEYESGRDMTAAEIVAECARVAAAEYCDPRASDRAIDGALRHGTYIDRGPCRNVILCGGEPLLQVNRALIDAFKPGADAAGWPLYDWTAKGAADWWFLCLETNGTLPAPDGIDWITCSPKVAEHAIKLQGAHELKYVRGVGQSIPKPKIAADHYLLSPVFDADRPNAEAIAWCIKLVKENPAWRLTMQHHKIAFGNIR